jgi:hypothetical protein
LDVILPLCDNSEPLAGNALLKYICREMDTVLLKSLESDVQFSKVVDALVAYFESHDAQFLVKACDDSISSISKPQIYKPVDFKSLCAELSVFIRKECQQKDFNENAVAEYKLSLDAYAKSRQVAVEEFFENANMRVLSSIAQTQPLNIAGKEWGIVYKKIFPLDVLPHSTARQLGVRRLLFNAGFGVSR